MNDAFTALATFPTAGLMTGPTPLDPLARLSDNLGIDLWIKRDDLTGLGFGGNKIRQLDYYLGDAQAKGADTILITGAVQSNYVRCAAAGAAKLGMHAILQLEERVLGKDATYRQSGNVLLDQMLGAELMTYPEGEDEDGADKALRTRSDELRAEGRVPYVIPLGLNNPPKGALGYMAAAQEIADQTDPFDAIIIASGSGMTHAGLLFGMRAQGVSTPVFGSCVRRGREIQAARIAVITKNIALLLGCENPVEPGDILTWDDALAPGYGKIGDQTRQAMTDMARMEGLFLDPVYTAKSYAAVPAILRKGEIKPGARVLYVHTGGLPALFAYGQEVLPR